MAGSREWVTVRTAVVLTFAVAVLSIFVGLFHISGLGVEGLLTGFIPDPIRRTVGFTGTITGFTMLGGAYALKNGYRIGSYATAVLLPLTEIQDPSRCRCSRSRW